MRCYLYFLRFSDDTVKIGFSQDLNQRLVTLERETGLHGTYLGRLDLNMNEARILERALHHQFGAFWVHGEWFKAVPEVLDELRRLLRDRRAVQQILDQARTAEREVKQQRDQRRSIVRVVARLARDLVIEAPDRPEGELAEEVKQRCAQYRIPYNSDVVARAIRCELWKVRHLRVRAC